MRHILAVIFISGLYLMSLASCATVAPPKPQPPRLEGDLEPLRPGDIVDTRTGRTISFQTLIDELARARIIYVGETHTNFEDHQIQQKIAEGLHARNPSLALAMEMFPRQAQPVLDLYSQGQLPEEEFLKEVNWEKVWGYPFELYRGLLSFAAEKHLKIIGLNVPHEVVRKISQGGLSSLSAEDRSRVAVDINLDDPLHRKYIQAEFDQHIQESIKDFDTFYEAQLAWEETMAETLAQRLASSAAAEQILVIVGKGHISYRFGVPQRAANRMDHVYKTVIPLPFDYPKKIIDPELSDYVWVTKKIESPHRARLGVMVREVPSAEGLEVLSVMPESPAAKAGIQKGDMLLEVNGIPMQRIDQLHEIVAQEVKIYEITLKRGKLSVSVTVVISQ